MGGLAVTAVLFFGIRAGARGTPHTMNKEYQEASDAYLKVRASVNTNKAVQRPDKCNYRRTTSSPLPVSLPRTTRVASWFSLPPRPRSKCLFNRKVFSRIDEGANQACRQRCRSLTTDWTKKRLHVQCFWSPLSRSNDEEKIPCTSFSYIIPAYLYKDYIFICFTLFSRLLQFCCGFYAS